MEQKTNLILIDHAHLEFLRHVQRELGTQDNRATEHPLFVVQDEELIVGVDSAYQEGAIPCWVEDGEIVDEARGKELGELSAHGVFLKCAHETYYIKRHKFVTACFTEGAANDFVERNRHNLRNPRVYVSSLYRNNEMIVLRKFIMSSIT